MNHKDKFVAYYAADNQIEEFKTFEEARKWLSNMHAEDGAEDGFAEETIDGRDWIANITHRSEFKETMNREKDGFVWDEEACAYLNAEGEEWPTEHDSIGEILMNEVPR